MTYKLDFKKSAYKEWNKLGATLREQFKKKLLFTYIFLLACVRLCLKRAQKHFESDSCLT